MVKCISYFSNTHRTGGKINFKFAIMSASLTKLIPTKPDFVPTQIVGNKVIDYLNDILPKNTKVYAKLSKRSNLLIVQEILNM